MKIAVCMPVRNGGPFLREALTALAVQRAPVERRVMMDTESDDGTPAYARSLGWKVVSVGRDAFDHGGTRQEALEHVADCDVVVFLTQDSILLDESGLNALMEPFQDPGVGVVFGRQVPQADADFFEAFPRCYNYPPEGYRRCRDDIPRFGIRAAFVSDSFAAWRVAAVQKVGGFARRIPGGEDLQLAARLLNAGYDVVYEPRAVTIHSHRFQPLDEFRRYFDIGLMHALQHDVVAPLGRPVGEGRRYVRAELHGAWRSAGVFGVVRSVARSGAKWLAYWLGVHHRWLPATWRRRLSTTRRCY